MSSASSATAAPPGGPGTAPAAVGPTTTPGIALPAAPPPTDPAAEARAALAVVHLRGDRWMSVLVALHAVLGLAMAGARGTWKTSLVVSLVAPAVFYALRWLRPGSFATRVVAGIVLQAFVALHIYQMAGLAEMHFFYFTAVTAMILYQDWRALWPGIAAIIVQHTIFSVLHNAGVRVGGEAFFEPDQVTATKLAWHYGVALAQAGIAAYAARELHDRTVRAAVQRATVAEQARTLGAANAALAAQAVALDQSNQRLQEQAAELEMQASQLQEQAAELEMRNEELATSAAALRHHGAAAETARAEAVEAQREAEAARAQAEHAQREAEAANVAKSRFLASMSHELRTPLNAVGGYAQLMAMGIRGPVTEDQLADLARIRRSSEHLLSLINDILQYAKLEAGQLRMDVRDVPLHPVLAELETLVGPQLQARRLAYRYEGCAASLVARADRERLVQVLLNLLTNAVKYTEPGGTIEVWCETLAADAAAALPALALPAGDFPASDPSGDGATRPAGPLVAIHVRDSGIGIPADMQRKVFDPFVQVRRTLSAPEGGVGLGLSISRDLARGMQGELSLASAPGEGSTFTLWLPLAAEAAEPESAEDAPPPAGTDPGAPAMVRESDPALQAPAAPRA